MTINEAAKILDEIREDATVKERKRIVNVIDCWFGVEIQGNYSPDFEKEIGEKVKSLKESINMVD